MISKAAIRLAENRPGNDERKPRLIARVRIPVGTLAALSVLAAILLLLAASKAAATPPERESESESIPPPIDVLDWYVGAVNMDRCCDCHTTVCK